MNRSDTKRPTVEPLLLALAVLGALHARETPAATQTAIACERDGIVRKISLRTDPEPGRVCDVFYEKPDENVEDRVLWFAQNDSDFCEPRFRELVETLASQGWTCGYADGQGEPQAGTQPSGAETAARSEATAGAGSENAPASPDTGTVAVRADAGPAEGAERTTDAGGRFREWCAAEVSSGDAGVEPVDDYCSCVLGSLSSAGMSDEDLSRIVEGIPPQFEVDRDGDVSSTANRSKRLNTLAVSYEHATESCR